MHVHATNNKPDRHICFCVQFVIEDGAGRRRSCTEGPRTKNVTEKESDTMIKKRQSFRADGQRKRSMDQQTEGFVKWIGRCLRSAGDICKYVVFNSNMAFSNVKHKNQSCRTCRMSVSQTFTFFGFRVMFHPLGQRTLVDICSFLFSFFVFLLFYSGCIVFDVHCTLQGCVVFCIALFSVVSGHISTDYTQPLNSQIFRTHHSHRLANVKKKKKSLVRSI